MWLKIDAFSGRAVLRFSSLSLTLFFGLVLSIDILFPVQAMFFWCQKSFWSLILKSWGEKSSVDCGMSLGRRERGTRWRPWMFGLARLSSALPNPYVKLFPAVHRKLPAEGPAVTASASAPDSWECGGGSIRKGECVKVCLSWQWGARRGWEQQLDSCGSHSPHVNKAPNMFAPSWPIVSTIQLSI